MPNPKCIVFAFTPLGKTGNASIKTIGMKHIFPACKNFVAISLVAYIPNQLIAGCIENVVQRSRKLNYPKACTKMPSINRHIVNDEMTQFVTELNQLGLIEFFYIVWAV